MAVNLNPVLTQPYFRRRDQRAEPNRIKRKVKLAPKHILLGFLLIGGFFLLVQQTYLFLITWERLEVDQVDIISTKPELKTALQNFMNRKRLGNLLLLDIKRIQKVIKSHPWTKDVQVKKVFPSTVRIEVMERVPIAVIKTTQCYLIDREGTLIQAVDPTLISGLPLIISDSGFEDGYREQFELAAQCLESLSPEQRKLIKTIDLSLYKCVSVQFHHMSSWVILGDNHFANKIQDFMDKKSYFEQFGELKSINMRFEDRYILTPRKKDLTTKYTPQIRRKADA